MDENYLFRDTFEEEYKKGNIKIIPKGQNQSKSLNELEKIPARKILNSKVKIFDSISKVSTIKHMGIDIIVFDEGSCVCVPETHNDLTYSVNAEAIEVLRGYYKVREKYHNKKDLNSLI